MLLASFGGRFDLLKPLSRFLNRDVPAQANRARCPERRATLDAVRRTAAVIRKRLVRQVGENGATQRQDGAGDAATDREAKRQEPALHRG